MNPTSSTPASSSGPAPAMLLARYATAAEVLHAAERVRDAGYTRWDVHSPFPVHGMDRAMGLAQSKLGWICFAGGALGLVLGFAMIYWMNGVDYPLVVGGKPPGALLSMVPVLFECTILFTGLSAVIGMLVLNRLPQHHHPIFASNRFAAATDDQFFVAIDASDPKFDVGRTRALLDATNAAEIETVAEER